MFDCVSTPALQRNDCVRAAFDDRRKQGLLVPVMIDLEHFALGCRYRVRRAVRRQNRQRVRPCYNGVGDPPLRPVTRR